MARLRFTPQADADLDRLLGRLDDQSTAAARKAALALWLALGRLADFPLSAPEVGASREQTVRFGRDGFIIKYDVDGEEVTVVNIFHGRQDRR